jgi:hypothetical protein
LKPPGAFGFRGKPPRQTIFDLQEEFSFSYVFESLDGAEVASVANSGSDYISAFPHACGAFSFIHTGDHGRDLTPVRRPSKKRNKLRV